MLFVLPVFLVLMILPLLLYCYCPSGNSAWNREKVGENTKGAAVTTLLHFDGEKQWPIDLVWVSSDPIARLHAIWSIFRMHFDVKVCFQLYNLYYQGHPLIHICSPSCVNVLSEEFASVECGYLYICIFVCILLSELQKRADHADQSVLFFLAGAHFWEKHAKNC